MRIIIDGREYEGRSVDSLTVKQALQFNRECAEHDYPWTWQDVERVRAEVRSRAAVAYSVAIQAGATEEIAQRKGSAAGERHPDALLLTAVAVWASRLAAGENVTFEETISTPLNSMRFLVDADDKQETSDPQ